MTRLALALLALVLVGGCYQAHPSSGLDDAGADAGDLLEALDAGNENALEGAADATLEAPDAGPDAGELCRVRWICYCAKDGGPCARSDGSECQTDDLLDPSADPCL